MRHGGRAQPAGPARDVREDGVERLTYNNPYALEIERIWFDGKIVYAVESGEVEVDFDENRVARGNKVAQEYQVVHAVQLDERGKLVDGKEPERVEGQYNIYDSIPGMEQYSPLWQFNYVVVPRDYESNTLRSEADCLTSGYPIERSTIVGTWGKRAVPPTGPPSLQSAAPCLRLGLPPGQAGLRPGQLLDVQHRKHTSSYCLPPGYRAAVGLQLPLISLLRTRKLRLRVNRDSATGQGQVFRHWV